MRLGAARFVAGETLDEAVVVLRRLNDSGLKANTTLLGEGVNDEAQTRVVVDAYREILDRIAGEGLPPGGRAEATPRPPRSMRASHQPTSASSSRTRPASATSSDSTWRSRRTSTLPARVPVAARGGPPIVGTVLQSYLYRTPADLEGLLPLEPNLRFVKGAYLEPAAVAYPGKSDVDAAYARLIERSLTAGGFTAIATHDETLIDHAKSFADDNDIPRTRFQFQMLYGVRGKLQLDLVREGYDVLVATHYGPDWYRYLMRRLAERPANVLFIARNLVRR